MQNLLERFHPYAIQMNATSISNSSNPTEQQSTKEIIDNNP